MYSWFNGSAPLPPLPQHHTTPTPCLNYHLPCFGRDASASVASGSTVTKGSLVGRGSTVEAGAQLDHCAVGRECHIGRGAVLQGSCLHARARVDDGCLVSSALLAEEVVVRRHAKLEVSQASYTSHSHLASHCK